MDWMHVQAATHLAASLLMSCLKSICTPAATCLRASNTPRAYARSPREHKSATMNSSSIARHFPRECTLVALFACLALFRLSFLSGEPLIAPEFFHRRPFVFYLSLSRMVYRRTSFKSPLAAGDTVKPSACIPVF